MSYKILSLDGGGSWALVQARVLLDLYGDTSGHELLREFDLVIANSGGALVLACLCNDMKISEIISVFEDSQKRKQVFSRLSLLEKFKWRNIVSLFTRSLGPRYSTERKLDGLLEVLHQHDRSRKERNKYIVDQTLDELPAIIGKEKLQLLIVGFDYFRKRANFFRSNPNSHTNVFSNGKYVRVSLAHAIHSSSNAPVNYFDAPAEIKLNPLSEKNERTSWYWDGAIAGFNNPVLAGVVEAITNNYENPQDYCILSIGTGLSSKAVLTDYKDSKDPEMKKIFETNKNNPLTITDTSFGFARDIQKLSTSILGDPPDSATFIAYSILDPSLKNTANLIRINPCVTPEKTTSGFYDIPPVYNNMPDGAAKFKQVIEMDMDAVDDDQVSLISDLCSKFIVTDGSPSLANQLIRGEAGSGTFLGDPTYKLARDRWVRCNEDSLLLKKD